MYQVDVYLRVRRAVMVDRMSIREVSRVFGLYRDTVRKILAYSAPPGYRRQNPPRRPKLEPFTGVIDQILADDLRRPRTGSGTGATYDTPFFIRTEKSRKALWFVHMSSSQSCLESKG